MENKHTPKYVFRAVHPHDYKRIAEIYNSNRSFLLNHLGVEAVDEAFVAKEVQGMNDVGFASCVVVNEAEGAIQGILDYMPGKEVYLSLLMLPRDQQGKGMGREIYTCFEAAMQRDGCQAVRIDVVNGYPSNAAPFWSSLGFAGNEGVTLEWGNKRSSAVVMRKSLDAKSELEGRQL